MTISFSIYGLIFDPYDFLINANHFPKDYTIWEHDEIMKDEGPGVTLVFDKSKDITFLPFSFGKFILLNKELLRQCANVEKEINITIDTEVLHEIQGNMICHYHLSPKLMNLLASLGIKLSISKTLVI